MLKVTLSGNLGADPEIRYTADGKPIMSMRVAVNTRRKEGDDWVDHTDWFRVRTMSRVEHLQEALSKGSRVFVMGRLEIGEYTSKDNERRTSLDVWADEVEYAARADRSTEPMLTVEEANDAIRTAKPTPIAAKSAARNSKGDDDDSLPF